jgi:DUF1365 family protein
MSDTPHAMLFTGRVAHVRHIPPVNKFSYRIWMLSVDLDRLDDIVAGSRLFRRRRFAAIALCEADHGPRDGGPLRPWVTQHLRAAGLAEAAARIHFLCIPRVLGFAFNPIAFYFCHDAEGRLRAVLHQVKNTFGGQHTYLLPVAPSESQPGAMVRQRTAKRLHVSPFFDMQGGYRFSFVAPDFAAEATDFILAIRYGTPAERRLTASMRLHGARLTDGALLRVIAAMPLMPIKVVAAIHAQAVRLWWRGARFHRAPQPPTEPITITPGVSA